MPSSPVESTAARYAQATEVFQRAWSTYELIVANNYMRHREMEFHLHAVLADRPAAFSLLDLGCGDSSMVARALRGTNIADYTGVELVEATTRLAEANLRDVVADRRFQVGNLIDAVRDGDAARYDVVLASYSVHHLSRAEKAGFFRDARRLLRDGGQLVLIDIVALEGESREQYLDRFGDYVRRAVTGLDAEQHRDMREHVHANDFPESQSTCERLAREAGFTRATRNYVDPETLFIMLTFDK